MFYTLLLVTFALALITSLFVATFFRGPVALLLGRLLGEEVGDAWGRYVTFALVIAGVAGGVPVSDLERMVGASSARVLVLNQERWVLAVFESVIATLGALASALTLFFVVMVLGQVLVRRAEAKRVPASVGVGGASARD